MDDAQLFLFNLVFLSSSLFLVVDCILCVLCVVVLTAGSGVMYLPNPQVLSVKIRPIWEGGSHLESKAGLPASGPTVPVKVGNSLFTKPRLDFIKVAKDYD